MQEPVRPGFYFCTKKWLDAAGACVWGTLAIAQAHAGGLMGWILAAQAGLAAFRLVFRDRPEREAAWWQRAAAWGLALWPVLAFRPGGRATWWAVGMQTAGVATALWAMLALGRSFGIAPADRGLVRHGPYRFIRHPMYAGEWICGLAVLVAAPTWGNGVAMAVLTVGLVLRVRWEEAVLGGEYEQYRREVQWRILPGVW
ncbi:MAG TPA: isoprenylcysteine carboxylmethyltransferase family protein [Planctomycetes bacterium]|nr:isoprenylcysteine carboxylmethyltransferase family protein [Planctomycetota bacterium]